MVKPAALFSVLSFVLVSGPAGGATERPNLIVILADDMGYSDPGCYGGEISTPAIDRMAEEGVRLSRFRNGGMCVVSRASLLTGKWWPRALPEFGETELLPERLQGAGYRTGLIGKWHLAGDPMNLGFDHFFGFLGGFADHFGGAPDYRLDRKPFKEFGKDFYSSDNFTDRAIDFVNAPEDEPKPFFLYLSYQAPHNPLQAPKEDILKYRGRYLKGWQAVREERFARQKEMGLFPEEAELPAYPENLPEWDSLTPSQKDLEDLRMATYAAMVERMDRGIGRLMEALRESGKAENTLMLFLSDNGTDSFSKVDEVMLKQGKLPGDRGSNYQPGTGWAYAGVTPWRLYKISQHGGGITTGAVAWWAGAKSEPGSIDETPLHMIDVLPTFLEAAGVREKEKTGESFLPLLKGGRLEGDRTQYFQYMDNRAIRHGKWTLAEVDGAGWELFDTSVDVLETNDLSRANPAAMKRLSEKWLEWWKTEGKHDSYVPKPTSEGPHYDPQGDRGTGKEYAPSAMPERLADKIPVAGK